MRLCPPSLLAALGLAAAFAIVQPQEADAQSGGWGPEIGQLLAATLGAGGLSYNWLPDNADPAQAREALGIAYLPIEGAAGNFNIAIGYYLPGQAGFSLAHRIEDLYGQSPRNTRFLSDHIEVTTTMPTPDDPRCCPTGTGVWSISRADFSVTRIN